LLNVTSTNNTPQIVFSESDVSAKLLKLKVNKSPGPDKLHPRMLYEIRNELVSPLTTIFNQSMCLSVLPDE